MAVLAMADASHTRRTMIECNDELKEEKGIGKSKRRTALPETESVVGSDETQMSVEARHIYRYGSTHVRHRWDPESDEL
jgi:hypothetical protein